MNNMHVSFFTCDEEVGAVKPAEDEVCRQANALKAGLELTGNSSFPRRQSFLLGFRGCAPGLMAAPITLSVELISKN